MTTYLKTKPGINGANTLSIPATWDAKWFRNFISNTLQGGDVRNATGTNGITVSGNIASPYATISGAGLINTVSGTTNEIAVSTTSGVATVSFAPNIVVPAPSSGASLVVNGVAQTAYLPTMQITAPNTTDQSNGLTIQAGTSINDSPFNVRNAAATYNYFAILGDGSWNFNRSGFMQTLAGSNAGNITIGEPPSGIALQVVGATGQIVGLFTGASGDAGRLSVQDGQTGKRAWEMRSGGPGVGIFDLYDLTAAASRLKIDTAGQVTINTPTSGVALTVNGTAAGTPALSIATSATTGAQTATFSASNKPGAAAQTSPAKWLPVTLDGTTYYIPAYS